MRKSMLFKSLFLTLFASVALTSCGSDDGGGSSYENLATTANGNGLTTFVTAAQIAGVDNLLTGSGDYTVLAPTNGAFDQFLIENGYANINAVPVALLKEIVLNHILNSDVQLDELVTGYRRTLAHGPASESSAISLYVKTDPGIKLNGVSAITTANVRASNGRIHIVDKVIPLPTIVTHLQANADLSSLLAALSFDADSQFIATLSGTGNQYPFTLFAPNNNGMNTLLNDLDVNNYGDIPADDLEELLSYHLLGGQNKFYTQLTDGTYLTLSGQNFTIQNTGGGKKITDVQDRTANFTGTATRDIQAWNGIIHVIDKGLLPGL
ncbi:fasciclin domain-containing protein [Flavobacterium sp. MAH-1]|uniref:Fasciclin domain-containing protein n=1 Tax=Flavobacterium agri TaxID=2743471 RepID=A0A7Y8Y4L6_9FLAO|nr:fasciclin domain-containing protein [Flavobacterium agri]NUY82423.1 fasciclin domain-containing protein [Flavobacterium agri]NYA72447.1 fasciclin domain-containing protein [Flavobacterium agri]